MPTPAQLQTYANSLPPIYRDILVAFSRAASPYRHYMEGMAVDVLLTEMTNRGNVYPISELYSALDQLEKEGFVLLDVIDLAYVSPTALGEELLETVTGAKVKKVPVPALPKPNW